jgi:acyl-CoA reductase-like NAD-dependent aldehyde dehydrogenase
LTVTVHTVADEDKAVRLANDSRNGLGSSVFPSPGSAGWRWPAGCAPE